MNKEDIIKLLVSYYETNKKPPKRNEIRKIISKNNITKEFGTFTNALVSANIPLNNTPALLIKCKNCDILFKKEFKRILKSKNNFCTRSCSATYNNKARRIIMK